TGQFLGLFLARLTLVAMLTWFLVAFLHLRMVSMTPSLSEARLQALQTRIRPHFLFNSLNTVLGLMRAEPRRAEFILENVADLFRVFMRDTRDLVPIADEIVTCRQYLAIEDLRLGGRLTVQWSLDEMKPDALIPSMQLQPLIENAVHHGIEPVQGPGVITVSVVCSDDEVTVQVGNTMPSPVETRPGNQMGLANVRERLSLLYDTSASFSAGPYEGRFHVTLQFPYRKERRSHVQRTFNPYS
ncbi:MAG: histidine kinase, partial [Quisquiliibacterium sp.]